MRVCTTGRRITRAAGLGVMVAFSGCRADDTGVPPATVLSAETSNHEYVVYAPDGRQVAYWAQGPDGWDLTVADADLEAPRVIASSPLSTDDPPHWSPDGTDIAYASMAGGFLDIWLASAAGAEAPRRLTEGAGLEIPTQFSADGRRLAFFLTEQGGGVAVRTLDLATGGAETFPGTDVGDLRIGFWSPDGSRIVYNAKDTRGLWTLWLGDSAGGNQRQITTEGFEGFNRDPWSPDGRAVLYESTRTGTGDIFVYPVDGEPRQLTRDVRNDNQPAWSPDGRWVAFRSDRGRQTDVWIVPAAGGTELRVTDDAVEEADIQWIPGTTRLAFTRGNTARGLWTRSVTDGTEQRLTPDSIRIGGWDLSPDRTHAVYQVQRGGGVTDLAIVAVAGGTSRTIVSGGAEHWQPRWSPDGSRVSFLSNRSGNVDVWVVDTAGGDPHQVTDWPTDEWNGGQWTADGSGVYAISPREADPLADLWLVPLDGSGPRRLTTVGTLQDVLPSPVAEDLVIVTFGGREGRWVLSRLRPDGRIETLWDRSNVMNLWSRGVTPAGDAIAIDVQTETGGLTSVLIPLRGGEPRPLLGEGETAADWSADGTQLLYTIGTDLGDIAVRSLTDGSTRRLTQTPDDEFNVRWTADGEHVVFVRETPRRQIVTVDVGSLTGR